MVQGELFREEKSEFGSHLDVSQRRSFLARYQIVMSLDKLLLVSIALAVTFILTYSFGVEQGKRTMEKQIQAFVPVHSDIVSTNEELTEPSQPPSGETVLLLGEENTQNEPTVLPEVDKAEGTKSSLPIVDLTKPGKFTVQLVTYNNPKQASDEVRRLAAKGHDSFVIPSGSYFQVCANYFENQSKAQNLLKQFRQSGRYPDAYVRPVVR
ncbi:MAG: SPOR domain-containing protein [Candidatus Omnitrophica bacterium]|nr:SPOR domain-containing protein [Candidatus Omnitrophota bacterium]